MTNLEELATDFLKLYQNLPMGIRGDICAVMDGEPMSFKVCHLEVKQKTELGNKILVYLKELQII